MKNVLRRYRAYLSRKVLAAKPGIGIVQMQWQTVPWIAPALLAVLLCYLFNLSGTESLFISIPLLGMTLFGISYVGWVFLSEGPATDLRQALQDRRQQYD